MDVFRGTRRRPPGRLGAYGAGHADTGGHFVEVGCRCTTVGVYKEIDQFLSFGDQADQRRNDRSGDESREAKMIAPPMVGSAAIAAAIQHARGGFGIGAEVTHSPAVPPTPPHAIHTH